MLAELRDDNKQLVANMRETHGLCDEHGDVATASLLENWIDEAERRTWFLFEATRTGLIRRRLMFKDEPGSSLACPGASKAAPPEQRGGSGSNSRRALPGEIGFVGLGHMGTAMAANLAAAGRRVIAYVRRPDQMGKLAALGLKPTTDIADLFDCEVVISMLPDDDAVRDVVFGRADLGIDGLALGMTPGAIHLSMSTISTAAAAHLASEHARHGQGYVAAPVFGNPDAARARQLFIVAAGACSRCRALPAAPRQSRTADVRDRSRSRTRKSHQTARQHDDRDRAGDAWRSRRCNSASAGLDPKPFIDFLTSTMFGGRVHKIYGDKIVRQSYAPGFVMPLALKDVRLALAEAESAGAPMPSVSVVRDRLITGIARGYADLDWTALGLIAAEEAGLHVAPPVASVELAQLKHPAPALEKEQDHGSSSRSSRNQHGTCRHSRHIAQGVAASRSAPGPLAGGCGAEPMKLNPIATIRAAFEHGINIIDTAPVYGFGRSEEIVGKAIAEGRLRSRVLIATKVGLEWEGGKSISQCQPRPHHAGDRGLLAQASNRLHRYLSGSLARPIGDDRRNRGGDARAVAGRERSAPSA